MDENHRDEANHKQLVTAENKIWLPPSYTTNKPPPVSPVPKKGGINWGFAHKSLWEWLLLLGTLLAALGAIAIPLVVTILGLNFTQQQHQTDLQISQDQQQAAILQTYIDNIQDLLLNHNLLKSDPLVPTTPYYDVAVLARARTLTALRRLDPSRKSLLLVFLEEAHLIGFMNSNSNRLHPIVNLTGADFSDVAPSDTDFTGVYLPGTNFSRADLSYTFFDSAELSGINFNHANLIHSNLDGDDLTGGTLVDAKLNRALLYKANLALADLSGADLEFANLGDADLDLANISNANLSFAVELTQQQLDQVFSCEGAILPKGLICHHNP